MESIDFKGFRTFFNKDVSVVQQKAQEALINVLREDKGVPVLFLISGGSAFDILSDMPSDCVGENITIGVLDERFINDPAINNFSQLEKTDFFCNAKSVGAQSISTRPLEVESVEDLAVRFERALRTWRNTHNDGVIIITQGIGPDGHTAGIMPFPEDEKSFDELFLNDAHWVCGYDVGEKNLYPLRVTTTPPFLRLVDYSIVYCVGQNKKEALKRVLVDQGSLAKTPARIIREMRDAKLFTDIAPSQMFDINAFQS